jgi:hypothetical protein
MNSIQNIPPPIVPTKQENGNDPESPLSTIVKLNHGNFTFECLGRKWDKRYRFEHPDLGLVIFDTEGENLIFTTVLYSKEEIQDFKRSVIAWQYLERRRK